MVWHGLWGTSVALSTVPNTVFTFSKLWIMAADFEVRQLDLAAARKLYGTALGMCPKERIFKAYLKLETSLANYDRARKIYEKYLETMPFNCSAWSSVRDRWVLLSRVRVCMRDDVVWIWYAWHGDRRWHNARWVGVLVVPSGP